MIPTHEYRSGFTDGFVDVIILTEPIKTGRHTYEHFVATKRLTEEAVHGAPFRAKDDYLDGYADGGDAVAVYLGRSLELGEGDE